MADEAFRTIPHKKDEYDIAQVCPNGHISTKYVRKHPERCKKFCETCGEENLTKCPACNYNLRGARQHYGGDYELPSYCHNCGSAFPWTKKKISAMIALSVEDGNLTDEEADQFKQSIQAISRDTPEVPLAATRYKKLFAKLGKKTQQLLFDMAVDVMSETAKKIITGS